MTTTTKVVPLSRSLDIAFNKLVLSQANVRQVNAGVSIQELSEDIGVRGLLQSLNVRPMLDENGQHTGKYEVPAGGRRFRALELLVKAKRLPKTAPIPCVIRGEASDTSIEDDSLAENTHRVALHPLDQYRAFLALRRQNMSEEDIAARYFVGVSVVKQRLRLAAVSPTLLDLYAADGMTLEQLMAFSITGDHARQEQVWEAFGKLTAWEKHTSTIKRMLTDSTVPATDRLALFVGTEAYEAAGGQVLKDLFHADNGGWFQDPILLDRLANEKLQTVAHDLKGEGWKWIEVLASVPYGFTDGLRILPPLAAALSAEDQVTLEVLKSEYDEIQERFADYDDDLPDEIDQRLGELETAIEALEKTDEARFDPAEIACAGAIVSIARDGQPLIMRGYVRPEDEPELETHAHDASGEAGDTGLDKPARETAIITHGAAPLSATPPEDGEGDTLRPLPERLLLELTAFRTVALRDAVARNPRIAMTLLLHKLVSDTFQHRYGGACLGVFVSAPQLVGIAQKGLNETTPATSMAHRRELWADILPADDQALWDWLDAESDEVRMELLAFCVSYGVDAVMERPNPNGSTTQRGIDCRLKQAERLADATGLDLVALGWRPTADTYLNRVPRARILEAVREGCGERSAQMIDHLKKGDMVVEAERLLADAGWLPEVLRRPDLVGEGVTAEVDTLPAFLDELAEEAPIAAE
jgi:ParB family chromosome partitioning protein